MYTLSRNRGSRLEWRYCEASATVSLLAGVLLLKDCISAVLGKCLLILITYTRTRREQAVAVVDQIL